MYKLVLFDFDGTILNSDPMLKVTFLELFAKYRPDYHPNDEHYFEFSGPPIKLTLSKEFPNMDQDSILKEFRELSHLNYEKYTKPYPDVELTLQALRKMCIPFGLVTNKARKATDHALSLNGLDKYFTYSVTSNDIKNQKPDPEGIFKAMKDFGTTNCKEVLYIGDSIYDYETSKNAGVDFGYCMWSPRKLAANSKINVKVHNYKDFAEKIRNGEI